MIAVEEGDRVRIEEGGKYLEVTFVSQYGWLGAIPLGDDYYFSNPYDLEEILDVYTKAEQEANGALVQFNGRDAVPVRQSATLRIHVDGDERPWCFLPPREAEALGEFHPVPDRAIVPGDVVRDASGVRVHEEGYWVGDATIVAPEDRAYREAKERGEDDGHDGWCGCADCGDGPDPAPEWQSWPLIADRDGNALRNISEIVPEHIRGEKRWASLDDQDEWFTDDEVAALGPVRRAVVITLPDDPRVMAYQGCVLDGTHKRSPDSARSYAAELLAAALHAEEGR